MAFIECRFHSDVLAKACGMNVIIPQKVETQIGMKSCASQEDYPVLYLLHGLSDDYTIWMRRSSIERYAAEHKVVIVMPDGGRSFYTDMYYGGKYWTFISEELPLLVQQFFPVSCKREDTYVAGLSMGGYGALKLALGKPERYSVCGAFSAVTDMKSFIEKPRMSEREIDALFGPERKLPEDADIFKLAEKCSKAKQRPRVFQCCGLDDGLHEENIKLKEHFDSLDVFDYTYKESPGYHSWSFWDEYVKKFLSWIEK